MEPKANPKQESKDYESDQRLKLIVTSLYTCSKSAKKQRLEIGPQDNLSVLGNEIATSFTSEDFVPPEGAFYFQYYDSEEDDMVGIPRLDEVRYLAKDFRNKRLTVVPIEKVNTQTKKRRKKSRKRNQKKPREEEDEEDSDSDDSSVAIVRTLPAHAKNKKRRKKRPIGRRQKPSQSQVSDSDDSSVVFMGVSLKRAKRKRTGEYKHPLPSPAYNFQKPGRS